MSSIPDHPIWLIGLPGAGKSRVGRLLADRLGRRFCDLDDRIVAAAGVTIAEIFREEGEAAFRRRETAALAALLEGESRDLVVACGGGIVERRANRVLIEESGPVLWLDLDIELALARCREGTGARPLLFAPGARDRLQSRIPLFQATGHRVDAAGAPPQVVQRLMDALKDAAGD